MTETELIEILIRLTREDRSRAEAIGEGIVAEGVRRALAAYTQTSEATIAEGYAIALMSSWKELSRAKLGTDTSNLIWVSSKLEKMWGVKVGPHLSALVLRRLKQEG